MQYYLAVDIGASSGRHLLGHMDDGKLCVEEVHRFDNGMKEQNGALCWDTFRLFEEIKQGMKKCAALGKYPVSVGIDTWGVDFVLLDETDKIIGDAVGYRDGRTKGMDTLVSRTVSQKELYAATGIQQLSFNTIYQLMALKQTAPDNLTQASTLLMIPDYFHFLLTGVKKTEYTNATTTQLVCAQSKNWDYDLIERLGYPADIFAEIVPAGSRLGRLLPEIQQEVGFDCEVVLPATHDTGSAVMAIPFQEENAAYISSGTWSLMGVERLEPDCSEKSRQHNFTNEGGYAGRYRYLKNIMGLWMVQSLKKELQQSYSFAQLCDLAQQSTISSRVDCNNDRFIAPASMIKEVQKACAETNQTPPETVGDLAAVLYGSLADCYCKTIQELELLTGKPQSVIRIVGGGANADYLNRLTAQVTGKKVLAGPVEATGIGNLLAQMLSDSVFTDLTVARACVAHSFPLKKYIL